jgi:predicted membrane protein
MENRRPQQHGVGQVLIGVAVIALGCLFLLENLGILDFDYTLQFWPVLLILAGALKLSQSSDTRSRVVGGVLIAFGATLILKSTGLLHVGWRTLGPLLLIAVGLLVIFKSNYYRKPGQSYDKLGKLDRLDTHDGPAGDDSVINVTAILGGMERRITTSDFRGGEVTAIMGGCQLDLRHASMQGEAVLNVFALCGGIEIKVPDDWTVSLQGTPLLGGFSEKTVPNRDAGKRLIVRGYAIMGGLEVRN